MLDASRKDYEEELDHRQMDYWKLLHGDKKTQSVLYDTSIMVLSALGFYVFPEYCLGFAVAMISTLLSFSVSYKMFQRGLKLLSEGHDSPADDKKIARSSVLVNYLNDLSGGAVYGSLLSITLVRYFGG